MILFFAILIIVLEKTASQCEKCDEFVHRRKSITPNIQSQENNFYDLEAKVVENKTLQVTFWCLNDYKLVGNPNVRCFPNGSWSSGCDSIQVCVEQCAKLENVENIQLTTTNRTLNTTVRASCKLPKYKYEGPPEITCQHGGWVINDGRKLSELPKCVDIPTYTSWKTSLSVTGGIAAAILFVIIVLSVCIWTRMKHGRIIDYEARVNPDFLATAFCVKVWNADRSKKRLIVANDLSSLRKTVCLEFGINGRIVLEADGTEIENELALLKNKNSTLMVLGKKEKWQISRQQLYKENYETYPFHVFTQDRQKSVMILCFSLENLCEQAFHMLGYRPEYICLECDGTLIDTDRALMVFPGSRLMAIKPGCIWTKPQNGVTSLKYSTNEHKNMFTVWTDDERKRKHVFAGNIVDLHFAAANALGLRPPVEITTMDGDLISDDVKLVQHANDVLLVNELRRSQKLRLREDIYRASSVYSA